MTRSMFIDASHAEETRVVVLDGKKLDDFDIETTDRKQIKGNIYLAKIVRVEPSLQAAFVDYGGNRHGFLAFSEIHPDYYQIPVADRQKLLELEAEEARRRIEADDAAALDQPNPAKRGGKRAGHGEANGAEEGVAEGETAAVAGEADPVAPDAAPADPDQDATEPAAAGAGEARQEEDGRAEEDGRDVEAAAGPVQAPAPAEPPEQLGGDSDAAEEARERRRRMLRNYKIQEVIHRRQVVLVQVLKEERGNKGAALTTYISLAGRFSVLMPNSPNGGGVSRKITAPGDRKRLKEVIAELEIPEGMGMIVRTAGAQRPKPEIKRDGEYLLRLWDDIRERTLASVAPALIYEEAALIKRAIRDVYTREVEQILVEGEDGFRTARDFMRMLMPSHARKVQAWQEKQPLFSKNGVEHLLDQIFQPTVQLPSGGYLVINQAEALVAIDVNSGRSTRERNIEDTALRTNLEAADEVARQLRLRDLAGLIVVDFIDMDARKHNAMVERRLKEALKADRARIQVGSISHFGLLEMSRQRLRPSLAETMLSPCPHCGGTGHVRSAASLALAALRTIEDEGAKHGNAELAVHLPQEVALYLFNNKRLELASIEERFGLMLRFVADGVAHEPCRIEKLRAHMPVRRAEAPVAMRARALEQADESASAEAEATAETAENAGASAGEGADAGRDRRSAEDADRGNRRRRRRRRRGRGEAPSEQAERPAASEPETRTDGQSEPVQPVAAPAESEITETPVPAAAEQAAADHVTGAQAVSASQADDQPELAAPPAEFGEPPEPAKPRTRTRRPARPRRTTRKQGAEASTQSETTVAGEDSVAAAAEAPAEETPAPRRRRRPARRRTAEPESNTPSSAAPEPVFTDIADIFEAAEQAETRRVTPPVETLPEASPAALRVEVQSVTSETIPLDSETATRVEVTSAEPETPSPSASVPAATAPETAASEMPVAESTEPATPAVSTEPVAPEAEPPAAAAEEPAEAETSSATDAETVAVPEPEPDEAPQAEAPRVQPVVIDDAGKSPAAPKRGWWRR